MTDITEARVEVVARALASKDGHPTQDLDKIWHVYKLEARAALKADARWLAKHKRDRVPIVVNDNLQERDT